MFELHVVVAGIVIFNILELIMKIVPNSPTVALQRKENNCIIKKKLANNHKIRWGRRTITYR
jgi:hypothetical protein